MRLALTLVAALIVGCGEPARVRECFDLTKKDLKDPYSATLVEQDLTLSEVTGIVVRASNSYGGFGLVWVTCKGGKARFHPDRSSWEIAF